MIGYLFLLFWRAKELDCNLKLKSHYKKFDKFNYMQV